eukprot:PITA_15133
MKFLVPYHLFCAALYTIIIHVVSVVVAEEVKAGSILRPSDKGPFWQSPNNHFSFGFYNSGNEGLYVLGIAFANINDTTLVWTAGPRSEIDKGAQLRFQSDGDLVLFNGMGRPVWKSDTANKSVVSALMRDDGNLVLKNRSSGNVWESFHNPTDTLLVGQAFTVGKTLTLYPYSFSFGSSRNLVLKWRSNITYWNISSSSQPSHELRVSLSDQGIFSLSNSTGFQLWCVRSSDYTDISVTRRIIRLDSDGNLRSYGWHEATQSWQVGWSAVQDQCRVYGWCGNFGVCVYNETAPYCICPSLDFTAVDPTDSRKGCRRKEVISSCPTNQSMVIVIQTEFLSYPPEASSDIFFLGRTDCWQNCLNNPTCSASTILRDGSGGCRLKTSSFTSAYHSPAIRSASRVKVCGPGRPLPPSSPLTSSTKKVTSAKPFMVGIILAVTGSVIVLIVFQTGLWWVCWRNNPRLNRSSTQYTLLEYASGAPFQFSYKELQQATKDFKDRVGSGGFGRVYKGILPNRTIVAVKKLEEIEHGEKEFRMEVATIGSTHHINLAKLIGFCSERRHRLLVYEFMKNTSLDNYLFASADELSRKLDWDTRFRIALGTARGITYLHEECRDCIIHCDIKPENILLDENFQAKVSDFGISKLINDREHRYRALSSIVGGRGYLAPEWPANLPITSKSDVFSYGMVLLELIGGRRNFDITATSGRRNFSTWAFEQFERGNISSIVDEKLGERLNMDQVQRAIQVSFWCIQEQSSRRPSMGKVVRMLQGVLPIERPPAPKSFEGHKSSVSANTSHSIMPVLATSTLPVTSPTPSHFFEPTDSRISTVAAANSTIPMASCSSGRVLELSDCQKNMQ